MKKPNSINIYNHDLPRTLQEGLVREGTLYGDTETDGLVFRRDRLRLVQLMDKDNNIFMVRNPDWKSANLRFVIQNCGVTFHHALFDYTFTSYWMNAAVYGDCTKVMSKIIHPNESSSLPKALKRYLNIDVEKDKDVTKSNWNATELSKEQIEYACTDVLYLPELYNKLENLLSEDSKTIYEEAMRAISNKVYLETRGYTDLMQYEHDSNTSFYRDQWLRHKAEMEK